MLQPLNRRDFARTLAAGAAIPLSAEFASAGEKPAVAKKTVAPETKESPEAAAVCDAEPVELILHWVRRQYPDERLDETAIEEIRDDVVKQLRRSRVLSDFPLTNADEPASVFTPFRSDRGEG